MKKAVFAVYGNVIQTIGEVDQQFNQVLIGKFDQLRFYVCNEQFHPTRDPLKYDTSACRPLNYVWFDTQTNGDLMELFEKARTSDDYMIVTHKIQQYEHTINQLIAEQVIVSVEPELIHEEVPEEHVEVVVEEQPTQVIEPEETHVTIEPEETEVL